MDSNDDQNSGGEEYDREDDSLSDDDSSSVSSVTYRNWVAWNRDDIYDNQLICCSCIESKVARILEFLVGG